MNRWTGGHQGLRQAVSARAANRLEPRKDDRLKNAVDLDARRKQGGIGDSQQFHRQYRIGLDQAATLPNSTDGSPPSATIAARLGGMGAPRLSGERRLCWQRLSCCVPGSSGALARQPFGGGHQTKAVFHRTDTVRLPNRPRCNRLHPAPTTEWPGSEAPRRPRSGGNCTAGHPGASEQSQCGARTEDLTPKQQSPPAPNAPRQRCVQGSYHSRSPS